MSTEYRLYKPIGQNHTPLHEDHKSEVGEKEHPHTMTCRKELEVNLGYLPRPCRILRTRSKGHAVHDLLDRLSDGLG